MADFPALPLFTDALIADAYHLSEAELGAYMKILILMWRTPGCRLPNDVKWHMRKLGVDTSKYNELYKPLLREFCASDGNWIYQKRLFKEWKYLHKNRKKQSDAAHARWEKEGQPELPGTIEGGGRGGGPPPVSRSALTSQTNHDASPPHPTPPHQLGKKTPLPPLRMGSGFKMENSEGREGEGKLVPQRLRECLPIWAPGIDPNEICDAYAANVRKHGMPRNIDKAFQKWVEIYVDNRKKG